MLAEGGQGPEQATASPGPTGRRRVTRRQSRLGTSGELRGVRDRAGRRAREI